MPRGLYLRSIGLLYDTCLSYVMKEILALTDLSEEEAHALHALGLSISVWTRELFDQNEIMLFDEMHEMEGEMHDSLMDRQNAFLPHWIAFQHLVQVLDWDMATIVSFTLKHAASTSLLGDYLLSRAQVRGLLMAIFGDSELRRHYLDLLSDEEHA